MIAPHSNRCLRSSCTTSRSSPLLRPFECIAKRQFKALCKLRPPLLSLLAHPCADFEFDSLSCEYSGNGEHDFGGALNAMVEEESGSEAYGCVDC